MKKHLYQVVVTTVMLISSAAFAQLTETMDQYAEQSQGNYQPMNMGYAGFNSSLGMIQEAWLDPLQNLGDKANRPIPNIIGLRIWCCLFVFARV